MLAGKLTEALWSFGLQLVQCQQSRVMGVRSVIKHEFQLLCQAEQCRFSPEKVHIFFSLIIGKNVKSYHRWTNHIEMYRNVSHRETLAGQQLPRDPLLHCKTLVSLPIFQLFSYIYI